VVSEFVLGLIVGVSIERFPICSALYYGFIIVKLSFSHTIMPPAVDSSLYMFKHI
jgi:hypothetical protein